MLLVMNLINIILTRKHNSEDGWYDNGKERGENSYVALLLFF